MAITTKKRGSKYDFSKAIDETVNNSLQYKDKEDKVTTVQEHSLHQEKEKKKGGRPSKGDVKKISLAIPVELYEGVETGAALFFKGNKTAYINALIKKDLQNNLEKYNEFRELI